MAGKRATDGDEIYDIVHRKLDIGNSAVLDFDSVESVYCQFVEKTVVPFINEKKYKITNIASYPADIVEVCLRFVAYEKK